MTIHEPDVCAVAAVVGRGLEVGNGEAVSFLGMDVVDGKGDGSSDGRALVSGVGATVVCAERTIPA